MIKKLLAFSILSLLFAAGCGEKKADPAKIDEATKLIANKDFDKGIADDRRPWQGKSER